MCICKNPRSCPECEGWKEIKNDITITTNSVYLNLPKGSLFKFTGVGTNGLLYQKIDDGTYRRVFGYNSRFDLTSTFISGTQGIRVVIEEDI